MIAYMGNTDTVKAIETNQTVKLYRLQKAKLK